MKIRKTILVMAFSMTLGCASAQQQSESDTLVIEAYGNDIVEMRDGSHLTCTIVQIGKSAISIKQRGHEGQYLVQIREVLSLRYQDGRKRVFSKK